jgi:uncharacterized membrane protein
MSLDDCLRFHLFSGFLWECVLLLLLLLVTMKFLYNNKMSSRIQNLNIKAIFSLLMSMTIEKQMKKEKVKENSKQVSATKYKAYTNKSQTMPKP